MTYSRPCAGTQGGQAALLRASAGETRRLSPALFAVRMSGLAPRPGKPVPELPTRAR
jgi:hypothetical protein